MFGLTKQFLKKNLFFKQTCCSSNIIIRQLRGMTLSFKDSCTEQDFCSDPFSPHLSPTCLCGPGTGNLVLELFWSETLLAGHSCKRAVDIPLPSTLWNYYLTLFRQHMGFYSSGNYIPSVLLLPMVPCIWENSWEFFVGDLLWFWIKTECSYPD